MFIRVKNKPTKAHVFNKTVQLVESYREQGKVKQRIIKHLGVAYDQKQLDDLKALAQILKEKLEDSPQLTLFNADDFPVVEAQKGGGSPSLEEDEDFNVDLRALEEQGRIVNGIHDIYGGLFDELNFKTIFKNPARNQSAVNIFKQIVMARIANPDSKRASVKGLEEQFGISLNLDQVYRMMDKLDDQAIKKLNEVAYRETKRLFNDKIDVIFFDATTLYFESFAEDEFKKNGYSKDLKFNQPQVVLALMVTKEGLPVGYQAFSGDTFDGHTLIPALEQLKSQYNLDKVVYVADSGMFNEANLSQLEERNFDYIVGARIKNLPRTLQEKILDISQYQPLNDTIKVARFHHKDRILVVTYSEQRAKKDRFEREKGIAKLKIKVEKHQSPKDYLSNQGYKKFLQLDQQCDAKIILNEEKIAEASRWDGLKGLIVSQTSQLSDDEILTQYNNLWQVEQSFRITKHDLKIRPIYHWKPSRVKAHLAISFAAYMLSRYLEYRVKTQYKKLSPAVIRNTLLSVQTSVLDYPQKKIKYGLPSSISTAAMKIYQLMGVKMKRCAYIIEKYK
jgi:transposase